MIFYDSEALKQLSLEKSNITSEYTMLIAAWTSLLLNQDARNYANHGFLRRVKTLRHCILFIFSQCPPDTLKMKKENLDDVTIYLQSFVFNTVGAIDNLAHILNHQASLDFANNQVGLTSKFSNFKNKLINPNLISELNRLNECGWFEYILNYRHALAHRIPLYVPPNVLTSKEGEEYLNLGIEWNNAVNSRNFDLADKLNERMDDLGTFHPLMVHSFTEDHKKMIFHTQLICDWKTIIKLSDLMIEELKLRV